MVKVFFTQEVHSVGKSPNIIKNATKHHDILYVTHILNDFEGPIKGRWPKKMGKSLDFDQTPLGPSGGGGDGEMH